MCSSLRFTLRVGLVLALGSCAFGCGGTKDLCASRQCESPLVCDPDDGVCKCGGRGGVTCPNNFVCDSATNTCQSLRCKGVDCSMQPGTSCDVVDGTCKCGGTGGSTCAANETCNPASKQCEPPLSCTQVACPKNQTCDQTDGKCKCGTATCAAGQFCSIDGSGKTCINDLCTGVKCSGATRCDQADGYCKCNGTICQSGEACSCPSGGDGGTCENNQRVCRPGSACAGVDCNNGARGTCDPVDGKCKCGGPGGPECASNQICALGPPAQCQGGQQCTLPDGGPKLCAGGTSCDPEDGKCKCGGFRGQLCAPSADGGVAAEICISTPAQQACRLPCDTRSPNCGSGTYCFYDSSAATPASYCAAATGSGSVNDACIVATSCFATLPPSVTPSPLHCNGLAPGQTGICRPYCEVSINVCPGIEAQTCVQIIGAPSGVGYCQGQ